MYIVPKIYLTGMPSKEHASHRLFLSDAIFSTPIVLSAEL